MAAILSMFSFLQTNWKVFAVMAAVCLIGYAGYEWRSDIKDAVYQKFYASDVKQALEEQQRQIGLLQSAVKERDKIIASTYKKNQDSAVRASSFESTIKTYKDAPAAEVLEATMAEINARHGRTPQ